MKFPVAAIILAAGLVIHGPTATAQFAEGDLVVIRVGTGSASLSSASTPVFLDEYRTGGLRVRSLPMPQAEIGGQQPFTLSGNATSEGGLSLSKDGRFLVCAGYGAAPGISAISSSSSSSVNRVVARTDATGAVDVSTRISTAFSGGAVRGATSVDGSGFWVTGTSLNGSGAGTQYVAFGNIGPSTQVLSIPNNCRWVIIAPVRDSVGLSEHLLVTSGSSGWTGVIQVGDQIAATPGQQGALLPGLDVPGSSPYGLAFDPTGTRCYVADDRAVPNGGVEKWSFDGTTWHKAGIFNGGLTNGVRGVAVDWSGEMPRIYATTSAASQNQIVAFTDSGGTGATATILARADSNTVFRGISFAPGGTHTHVSSGPGSPAGIEFSLYPNPFNPATRIHIRLRHESDIVIRLYDLAGRMVIQAWEGHMAAGDREVIIDASALSSGIYLCRLTAGGVGGPQVRLVRKLLLVR